jgi:hypothetical protein
MSNHCKQQRRVGAVVVVVLLTVASVVSGGGAAFRADYSTNSTTQGEGTRFIGTTANEYAGYSVSGGGDVDGDGVADFVVGAHRAASLSGESLVGHAYVLYGVANASDAAAAWPIDSALLDITQDSTRGRIIDGGAESTYLGQTVAIVGDVNGDRLDDIAISSCDWSRGQGKVWVVWGKKRAEAANPLSVKALDASEFVEITGEAPDNYFGWSIAGGDFNHDGISDLLIGAPYYSSHTGCSYIVWGHDGTWPTTISATGIGGTVGTKINGEVDSNSGISVANAGDVNHDGKTDLIIGAPLADTSDPKDAGRAYIVFGKDNGTWSKEINLDSLTTADGVIINGVAANDLLGQSVSGNVDVNGDNTADVIVGAPGSSLDGKKDAAGTTYVVFGSAILPSTIDASSSMFFDGTNGFKLFGEMAGDYSGMSVSGAGDVNGDGIGDIIIGAYEWDLNAIPDVGRSYVVLGHRGAWPAMVELSSLDGKNGFTISGNLDYEHSGNSVSGAGDINNDGLNDIIVGAPGWNGDTGRAVVVYGSCSAG